MLQTSNLENSFGCTSTCLQSFIVIALILLKLQRGVQCVSPPPPPPPPVSTTTRIQAQGK